MKKLIFLMLFGCLLGACATPPLEPPALSEYSQGYKLVELSHAGNIPVQGEMGSPGTNAWNNLKLSGSLILILQNINGPVVARLHLSNGAIDKLFQAEDGAILTSALVSPDHQHILLVYSPPATSNTHANYTSLYTIPIDGSSPPFKLIQASHPRDAFFAPVWAPDGKSIYASHYYLGSADGKEPAQYRIDQVDPQGQIQAVLNDAEFPAFSLDGTRLAYVSIAANGASGELQVADAHGAGSHPVLAPGAYPAVDNHIFTADGKTILFSAVNGLADPTPTPTLFDRIFGIQIASAHTIPSDWYAVPTSGGAVHRITGLNSTGLSAALSPDGRHVAFISQDGIYVMNADGSDLAFLANFYATGSVDWIP